MQPPTWKCKIEKCHRSDVPTVPKDELPKGEERSKVVVKSTDMHAEEMVVELDDWLIDFANLFRDHLGIDPDKYAFCNYNRYRYHATAEKCSRCVVAHVVFVM